MLLELAKSFSENYTAIAERSNGGRQNNVADIGNSFRRLQVIIGVATPSMSEFTV